MSPFAWFKTCMMLSCALIAVSVAHAEMIVDTGTPLTDGQSIPALGTAEQSLAGRFEITQTTTITSLSAFVASTFDQTVSLGIASGPDIPAHSVFTTLASTGPIPVKDVSGPLISMGWVTGEVDLVLTPGTWWITCLRPTTFPT